VLTRHVGAALVELAAMHGDLAPQGGDVATIKPRLDRIEPRLGLADAPA